MGAEIAIALNNVSKCYQRYARPIDRLKEILIPGISHSQEFWALKDISLEMRQGETWGIIGQNGSGKSTLLQIVAGTLTPTSGALQVNGRVSALLELGSGFNPEFTGRQNVFFNGQILGLSKREIEAKFDDIAAFADIGDFIDRPVKTYSSGMFVRLAFAVAINVDPDILIVDEALSVGDIFFQQKCYKFLEEIRSRGASVIFVSHDTQAVLKLCEHAILLDRGCLSYLGKPSEVVSRYMEMYYGTLTKADADRPQNPQHNSQNQAKLANSTATNSESFIQPLEFRSDFTGIHRYGEYPDLIAGIAISDINGNPQSLFRIGEDFLLSVQLNAHLAEICPLNVGFQIRDRLGQIMIGTNTYLLSIDMDDLEFGKPAICQFKINLPIIPQEYTLNVAVANYDRDASITYDWLDFIGTIQVVHDGSLEQVGFCFANINVVKIQN